ncbi:MAG: hypothetical protein ACK5KT_16365 [Dysgonomonas sp.]
MKYGSKEQNLYSGTVTQNIPIYSYQDMDFNIPISLNYASNGYLPGIQASQVGLGWYLNVGGNIMRQVRELPDDLSEDVPNSYSAYDDEFREGFYSYHIANTTSSDDPWKRGKSHHRMPDLYPYINARTCLFSHFYTDVKGKSVKSETLPDIFTFNFLGFRGKFMMGPNKHIYVYDTSSPYGEFKIEFSNFQNNGAKSKIIITTADGYIYTFGGNENFAYIDRSGHDTNGFYNDSKSESRYGHNYEQINWPLTKITAPNGRFVTFEYQTGNSSTCRYEGVKYRVRPTGFAESISYFHPELAAGYFYPIGHTSIVAYIKSINVNDETKIDFKYHDRIEEKEKKRENPIENIATLPRLGEISIQNYSTNEVYKTTILEHIYTPSTGNQVLLLNKVSVSGEGSYSLEYYDGRVTETDTPKPFPYHGTCGLDHWGFYNNKNEYIYPIYEALATNELPYLEYHKPDYNGAILGMLKKIIYPTKGYSQFYYEPNTYKSSVGNYISNEFYPLANILESQKVAGGVRLKRIEDYASDNTIKIKTYSYSEGILLHMPLYYMEEDYCLGTYGNGTSYMNARFPEPVAFTEPFLPLDPSLSFEIYAHSIRYGSMLNGRYSYGSGHSVYTNIKEINEDNSYTEYKYTRFLHEEDMLINRKLYGQMSRGPEYESPVHRDFYPYKGNINSKAYRLSLQSTDVSMFHGKLSEKTLYNSSNKPVYKITNEYSPSKSPKVYKAVTDADVFLYELNTYVESLPLSKTSEEYYYEDKVLTNETNYSYNAEGQISCIETIESGGEKRKVEYQYVQDIPQSSRTSNERQMITYNAIKPVRVQTSVAQKNSTQFNLVKGEHRTYADKPPFNLYYIRYAELSKPTYYAKFGFDGILNFDYLVYGYNKMNRVYTVSDQSDKNSYYLWGYRGKYPIARIENINRFQLPAALKEVFGVNDVNDILNWGENEITLEEVNKLRASTHLKNAHIYTYTYKPLVGLLTETSPSGITTYYEYDNYNRLKRIYKKDGFNERNIESYEYNFRNE